VLQKSVLIKVHYIWGHVKLCFQIWPELLHFKLCSFSTSVHMNTKRHIFHTHKHYLHIHFSSILCYFKRISYACFFELNNHICRSFLSENRFISNFPSEPCGCQYWVTILKTIGASCAVIIQHAVSASQVQTSFSPLLSPVIVQPDTDTICTSVRNYCYHQQEGIIIKVMNRNMELMCIPINSVRVKACKSDKSSPILTLFIIIIKSHELVTCSHFNAQHQL
jgi:hypothetical protein